MSRLFDADAAAKKAISDRARQAEVKRRADEIQQLLNDELELDKAGAALGDRLAQSQPMGVQAIHYKAYRQAGSKWMIEHTIVGDTYVYQMFPLRPIRADWRDTIVLLIAAMDQVFPRSTQINYVPPNDRYQIKCFTVRVEHIVGKPGWQDACEHRTLKALAGVPAWD